MIHEIDHPRAVLLLSQELSRQHTAEFAKMLHPHFWKGYYDPYAQYMTEVYQQNPELQQRVCQLYTVAVTNYDRHPQKLSQGRQIRHRYLRRLIESRFGISDGRVKEYIELEDEFEKPLLYHDILVGVERLGRDINPLWIAEFGVDLEANAAIKSRQYETN